MVQNLEIKYRKLAMKPLTHSEAKKINQTPEVRNYNLPNTGARIKHRPDPNHPWRQSNPDWLKSRAKREFEAAMRDLNEAT